MNMVQVLNVKLKRDDSNVHWGFDVKGGKDFNFPLAIQSVAPNSLADLASIRADSFILRVGNISTENLTHDQAKELIFNQGNILEMTMQWFSNLNCLFEFLKIKKTYLLYLFIILNFTIQRGLIILFILN